MNTDLFIDIATINQWLDIANAKIPEDSAMRVMKIGEEYGEAVQAYIGMTGQNPRKGITHTKDDLCNELADVAITALCAIAYFNNNSPILVEGIMDDKIQVILKRVRKSR